MRFNDQVGVHNSISIQFVTSKLIHHQLCKQARLHQLCNNKKILNTHTEFFNLFEEQVHATDTKGNNTDTK